MSSKSQRVLVTGASGFVGSHLCQYLLSQGWYVRGVGRNVTAPIQHAHFEYHVISDLSTTRWETYLASMDSVVHLAARVHQKKKGGMQCLPFYQQVNVQGTRQLARAARACDVKRFVYISTIKVNGEKTISMPFRAEDPPQPQEAYSFSKLQGERIVQEEARRSGMEWVIIRPPLVYGAYVKGHFRRLLEVTHSVYPLPFALLSSVRSLVSVENLCSFIECCLIHPHAASEIFLVSDGKDVSIAELMKCLRQSMGKRGRLFPFPLSFLKLFGYLTGQGRGIEALFHSLQVNIEKSNRLLGWYPPFTLETALKRLYVAEHTLAPQQRADKKIN